MAERLVLSRPVPPAWRWASPAWGFHLRLRALDVLDRASDIERTALDAISRQHEDVQFSQPPRRRVRASRATTTGKGALHTPVPTLRTSNSIVVF